MDKYFEEVNGKKFPVRLVPVDEEEFGCGSPLAIADYELDVAIKDAIKSSSDNIFLDELSALDNEIFFYCDSGFIANDPTDMEIVEYLRKHCA